MTKSTLILISFLSLTLLQCSDKTDSYKDLKLPDSKEYNEIIFAILKQDTVFVNEFLLTKQFTSPELAKTKINMARLLPDTNRVVEIEFPAFQTSVLELRHYKITDSLNLETDSIYFAFQNDSSKIIPLDTNLIDFARFATKGTIKINRGKPGFGYFQFSTPVLNKAHTKALVRADFLCFGECGGGMLYLLDKKNGKWTLTFAKTTWVS